MSIHQFNYVLRFPNGTYYTGRVNSDKEPNAWQGEAHQAFTYTQRGAYTKKQLECFRDCAVDFFTL